MLKRILLWIAAVAAVLSLSNCATQPPGPQVDEQGRPINPHPPGTYEHFTWDSSYPKTSKAWKNQELLAETDAGNSHLRIDLERQRGFLMNGDAIVIDYPICTGTRSHPTPKGEFQITEKIIDKSSNRYGRMYDADGKMINGDADAFKQPVPEGGKFVGAPMRYWMRLTSDGIGHHIGPVLRRPASHGCIRGPTAIVPTVYSKVKHGTRVVIE